MVSRRLKNSVSGSSWRRASLTKSCALALMVRSAAPAFWQATKRLLRQAKSNVHCASSTRSRSFLPTSICVTSALSCLASARFRAVTNNIDPGNPGRRPSTCPTGFGISHVFSLIGVSFRPARSWPGRSAVRARVCRTSNRCTTSRASGPAVRRWPWPRRCAPGSHPGTAQ
ncbi:MAG: hypothetical protein ACD_23C00009G0001 [uncultured bacterium]|nr:MAG: hypothetical protein ACD_23C00009G0001 [uncultured bacterium]